MGNREINVDATLQEINELCKDCVKIHSLYECAGCLVETRRQKIVMDKMKGDTVSPSEILDLISKVTVLRVENLKG